MGHRQGMRNLPRHACACKRSSVSKQAMEYTTPHYYGNHKFLTLGSTIPHYELGIRKLQSREELFLQVWHLKTFG